MLLKTPASRYLADLVAHDRIYREMLLTDRYGRLVAASDETSDYFQGDEDWWTSAAGGDRAPGVSLTDVRWDDSARDLRRRDRRAGLRARQRGVRRPAQGGRRQPRVARDGRRGATRDAPARPRCCARTGRSCSAAAPAIPTRGSSRSRPVRERAETIVAGGPQGGAHFQAGDSTGTAQMVGIAASQLSRSYPNVNWVVAVSQSEAELLAPFRLLGWYLLAVVAATVLAMFVAAIVRVDASRGAAVRRGPASGGARQGVARGRRRGQRRRHDRAAVDAAPGRLGAVAAVLPDPTGPRRHRARRRVNKGGRRAHGARLEVSALSCGPPASCPSRPS